MAEATIPDARIVAVKKNRLYRAVKIEHPARWDGLQTYRALSLASRIKLVEADSV